MILDEIETKINQNQQENLGKFRKNHKQLDAELQ